MQPLIGIPTRTQIHDNILHHATPSTYTHAVELAGGAPVLVPLRLGEDTLRDIFARLDGLLIVGGADVHPSQYGEQPQPYCGQIDSERDAVELRLLHWALDEKVPLLGICRGIQMLNVAAGGTLYQDIAAQLQSALPHAHREGNPYNLRVHAVEIDGASRLARALGAARVEVNSLHHQAIKQIAPGFHVVARAPDGIVEGIEAVDGRFAVGVQFHPEWLLDEEDARMLRVFQAFVEASKQG